MLLPASTKDLNTRERFMEYRYSRQSAPLPVEESHLTKLGAEGWRVTHVIQAWTDAEGASHDPVLLLERDKPIAKRHTTDQDLVDRWLSFAFAIARRGNTPTNETLIGKRSRETKVRVLLDCAWELICSAGLPGPDPRDTAGLDAHMNRMADRAKPQHTDECVARPLPVRLTCPGCAKT